MSGEKQGVVDECVLRECFDQPAVCPRRKQLLSVLVLRLGEVIECERDARIARRKLRRQPLERLGSVVVRLAP